MYGTYLVTEVGVDADKLATVDSSDALHVDGSLALGVTLAVAARSVDLAIVVGIYRSQNEIKLERLLTYKS